MGRGQILIAKWEQLMHTRSWEIDTDACTLLKKILFIPSATILVSVATRSPYIHERRKTAEGNDYKSSLVILLFTGLIICAVENTISCRHLAYSCVVQTRQWKYTLGALLFFCASSMEIPPSKWQGITSKISD